MFKKIQKSVTQSQVWKSIFRVGIPTDNRKRALAMLGNVVLHLHPIKVKKSGLRMSYTWCMGGTAFFLFLVETITGLLLMFYYRPTVQYAYADIIDLGEHVPLGVMRELHRWGAHAMVITVWLHMFRVFMTGSYKPPREFNWVVGVILLLLTLLLPWSGWKLLQELERYLRETQETALLDSARIVAGAMLAGLGVASDSVRSWSAKNRN